ncbi:hypothetical protein [Vibrio phage vB_ValS_PJ32]|nr:hypothetical protein [Vibrio phage vB_ValS_PJ32]
MRPVITVIDEIGSTTKNPHHHYLNELADELLASSMHTKIKARLEAKRNEGRYGWFDPDVCSLDELKAMLQNAIDNDEYLDAAIFSSFIALRLEGLAWAMEAKEGSVAKIVFDKT